MREQILLSAGAMVDNYGYWMPFRPASSMENRWNAGAMMLEGGLMRFVDTSSLKVIERLPGWYGRYFHTPSMTFAHYDFKSGSTIHEHFHPQEEVYEVIESGLEVTIEGAAEIVRAGLIAIAPSNVAHSVKALTDSRAIIVDYPLRREFD
jgi:mannose-6-phosphate isomerase-like protein (cupin superfamily)